MESTGKSSHLKVSGVNKRLEILKFEWIHGEAHTTDRGLVLSNDSGREQKSGKEQIKVALTGFF